MTVALTGGVVATAPRPDRPRPDRPRPDPSVRRECGGSERMRLLAAPHTFRTTAGIAGGRRFGSALSASPQGCRMSR